MADPIFNEEQIASALRQAEAGTPVEMVCNDFEILETTFADWQRRYSGLSLPDLRRLRQLERDIPRLRKLLHRLTVVTHTALVGVILFGAWTMMRS